MTNDAETCRQNGWGVGTRLIGDEGHGASIIEITAVGERSILAKLLQRGAVKVERPRECCWTLSCREWSEVEL